MTRLTFIVALAASVAMAQPAAAQAKRYAVIVEGASGEEQYATLHREWVDSLSKLRAEQDKLPAPRCGGGEEAARKLGESTATLKTLLPETPNERLVYACRAARGG